MGCNRNSPTKAMHVFAVACLLFTTAEAITVTIDANTKECFYEFTVAGERIVGSYEVSAGGSWM